MVTGLAAGEFLSDQGDHTGDVVGELPPVHGMVTLGCLAQSEPGPGSQHSGSYRRSVTYKLLRPWVRPLALGTSFLSYITGLLTVPGVLRGTEWDELTALSPVPRTQ